MSSLLEEPPVQDTESAARRLQAEMAAVRLSFTWPGVT